MSVQYNLTTPANVGTLTAPINVTSLVVTSIQFSTAPGLAPIGTGELIVTLTDMTSGWQETIRYLDASVLSFFAQLAPTPQTGSTVEDIISSLVLQKLVADKKLPSGTISTT